MYAGNFLVRPWPLALGQQLYAFVLGIMYAYWLEKSGSVLASSLSHGLGDGVEYGLLFIWVAA